MPPKRRQRRGSRPSELSILRREIQTLEVEHRTANTGAFKKRIACFFFAMNVLCTFIVPFYELILFFFSCFWFVKKSFKVKSSLCVHVFASVCLCVCVCVCLCVCVFVIA